MIGLEKGITKEAVRMAWPAVCESFFIALAGYGGFTYGQFHGSQRSGSRRINNTTQIHGVGVIFCHECVGICAGGKKKRREEPEIGESDSVGSNFICNRGNCGDIFSMCNVGE